MADDFPGIDSLIPHRGAMQLVDRVVAATDSSITVAATIEKSSHFLIEGVGVPTYVGLELMAQAVSAFDGLGPADGSQPGQIGFLLGCRRYTAYRPTLEPGENLVVSATLTFLDGAMGVFDCEIVNSSGEHVAKAAICVYRPTESTAAETHMSL